MATCKECIHDKVCVHKANIQTDTYAYMGVSYNTEKCEHYKPTADVVPKSEVEALVLEIERLKKSMLPSYYSACSEEEAIKIGKQYGRAEVAREIFDDIKCSILAMSTLALFSYTDNLEESNAKQKCYKYVSELIDELDKRYTEGEPNG